MIALIELGRLTLDMTAFTGALGLLLIMPGPTNTVLAVAGSERGFVRGVPLIFMVVFGYLTTVLVLLAFAAPLLHAHPALAKAVAVAAAVWVLTLAVRMWRSGAQGKGGDEFSALALYTTTVLNPKGLVIGLALLPEGTITQIAPYLAAMVIVVSAVSLIWLSLGATAIRSLSLRHPVLVSRGAAGSLAVFAAALAGRAAGWV